MALGGVMYWPPTGMVFRAGCDGQGGLSLGVIGFGAVTVIAEAQGEQVNFFCT